MVNIYVAAPWVAKDQAIAAAAVFRSRGYNITSRWFQHEGDPNDSTGINVDIEKIRQQAREDIEDVLAADFLVVLNIQKSEGKAVETGIAIANEIPVVSVGPRSNIFQSLGVEVDNIYGALDWFKHVHGDLTNAGE